MHDSGSTLIVWKTFRVVSTHRWILEQVVIVGIEGIGLCWLGERGSGHLQLVHRDYVLWHAAQSAGCLLLDAMTGRLVRAWVGNEGDNLETCR